MRYTKQIRLAVILCSVAVALSGCMAKEDNRSTDFPGGRPDPNSFRVTTTQPDQFATPDQEQEQDEQQDSRF